MEIENELKGIRYLLNDLILCVYDLRVKLDEISPSKRPYTMGEPNRDGSSVHFDLFSIKKEKYKELIDAYGEDLVNKACVRLDDFIKLNEYIPYRHPHLAIVRRFIKEIKKEEQDGRE